MREHGVASETLEERVARLRAEHEARARAELKRADALAPGADICPWSGALVAEVALVKGLPGPAEAAGGHALSGPDGDAAAKALAALGWEPGDAFRTLSRPFPEIDLQLAAERLRAQIEAVDPGLVIALDAVATEDLARAFNVVRLRFGQVVRAGGRRLLAVDGLEASLTDAARKRRVWRQLKAGTPEGPIF